MSVTQTDPIFWVTVFPPKSPSVRVEERITSLSYEDDEKKVDRLLLTVDNYDLQEFDKPIWQPGNKIEVSWGYPGLMSWPRECYIQNVKGGLTLQVEALDKAAVMHKVQRTGPFKKMKRSDIAKQIAEEYGYAKDQQFIDDSGEVIEHINQARMTDLQLLHDMARREGFVFFVDYDGFHFHARKLGQKPIRRFTYFVDKTGDILNWNIDSDIYTKKTGSVVVRAINPLTKEEIKEVGTNDTSKATALAPRRVLVMSERDLTPTGAELTKNAVAGPNSAAGITVNTTEKTKEAAKRQAVGIYNQSALGAIELTLECRGDPLLVAKSVVEVVGIGRTISGNYYVKTVQHKLGDGYRMVVKLKRDGRSAPTSVASSTSGTSTKPKAGDAAPGTVTAKGPVNAAKPPKGAPGTVSLNLGLDKLLIPLATKDAPPGMQDFEGEDVGPRVDKLAGPLAAKVYVEGGRDNTADTPEAPSAPAAQSELFAYVDALESGTDQAPDTYTTPSDGGSGSSSSGNDGSGGGSQ